MPRPRANYSAVVAIVSAVAGLAPAPSHDPFVFLSPDIAVSAPERAQLDAGQTLVRVLPDRDGLLSLSALVRLDVAANRLIAWGRSVEVLQKGKYIPEIGRFSNPPQLEDLSGLTIPVEDLEALERCRPGNCGLKLSAAEIGRVQAVRGRPQLERSFRQIIVDRAAAYLTHGDASALPYHDHKTPVRPEDAFASVVQRLEFFSRHLPAYEKYLRIYPRAAASDVQDSFLYWSKETLGRKPIISVTHFTIARFDPGAMPEAAVVAKQVYATHYRDASITFTALTGAPPHRYLVYAQRARIDAFQGLFGGLVRRIVERRVKAEAPGVLRGLRKRLESGDPPVNAMTTPVP
jgi:hypothetical protein